MLALAGVVSAQEARVDLDLDAFADALVDALDLEGGDAWEERVDPAVERAWLAGLPDEPEVEDVDAPPPAAVVGLSLRAGDLTITRLVAPDRGRARAIAARLLAGHTAPLGHGPRGQAPPRRPALVEVRGAHLLVLRGPAVLDAARALPAREAAWAAPGLPPPPAAEALAVVDDDLLVIAARADDLLGALAAGERLAPGVGLRAPSARADEARAMARALARAAGIALDPPAERPSGDRP